MQLYIDTGQLGSQIPDHVRQIDRPYELGALAQSARVDVRVSLLDQQTGGQYRFAFRTNVGLERAKRAEISKALRVFRGSCVGLRSW